MRKLALHLSLSAIVTILFASHGFSQGSEIRPTDRDRDGYFEITLRSPENPKLMVEEIIRDRDLDPNAIFRVRLGGYLAFDQRDWVKDIEFKVFDVPVTELPLYRTYADLLQQVNVILSNLKVRMTNFDMVSMRLLNVEGHRRFKNMEEIDSVIKDQLLLNNRLQMLKSDLIRNLNEYVQKRTVEGQHERYLKNLDAFVREFKEQADRLNAEIERLERSAGRLFSEKVSEEIGQSTSTTAQVSGQRQIVDPFASGQLKLDE